MFKKIFGVLVLLAAVLAATLAMPSTSGAAIDSAVLVPTPNSSPSQLNFINSVDCVSSTMCVAVGLHATNTDNQTYAMKWDGTSWLSMTTPNVPSTGNNALISVDCVSATWCMASGYAYDSTPRYATLTMVWDGTTWTIVPSPNPTPTSYSFLNSVVCFSTTSCLIVGGSQTSAPLVMTWNGTTWTLGSAQAPPSANGALFREISCVSASWCVAVGEWNDGSVGRPLVETWNGSAWTYVSSSVFAPAMMPSYYGVSCASTSFCIAVGYNYTGSMYEALGAKWDGTTWSAMSITGPGAGTYDVLSSVQCPSPLACVAVGESRNGSVNQTWLTSWDGSTWSTVATPNNSPSQQSFLSGVSCWRAGACATVGAYDSGQSIWQSIGFMLSGPEPVPTTTTVPSSDPVVPAFTG